VSVHSEAVGFASSPLLQGDSLPAMNDVPSLLRSRLEQILHGRASKTGLNGQCGPVCGGLLSPSPPGRTLVSWATATLLGGAALAQTTNTVELKTAATQWRSLNYIVVTPNGPTDGGDFGPGTPGTKTSGLQEAFNRAHEEVRDIYIVGGGNNSMLQKGVSYRLDQTLRIPWMQDWRLDGGECGLLSSIRATRSALLTRKRRVGRGRNSE